MPIIFNVHFFEKEETMRMKSVAIGIVLMLLIGGSLFAQSNTL